MNEQSPESVVYKTTPNLNQETAGAAIASLVLGILSLLGLGFISGIPAILCAKNAKAKIKESDGRLGGAGLAMAGVITGWIGTTLSLIGVLIWKKKFEHCRVQREVRRTLTNANHR